MVKQHHKLLVPLLAIMLLAACQHDGGEVQLRLYSESMGGKMSVRGQTAEWSNGDELLVNGTPCTISVDNAGHAQVSVTEANNYNAAFPASLVSENSIVLPEVYHYAVDGEGKQLLDLPMVASGNGNDGLFFHHVTGALVVKFSNHSHGTLVMDSVTVQSSGYALSGPRTLAFGTTHEPVAGNGSNNTVAMVFDRQQTTLAQGDTLVVMLPVAPVGNDNRFTISVRCHHDGTSYRAHRTQSSDHPLARNELGYVYMNDSNLVALPRFRGDNNSEMHIFTAEEFQLMVEAINSNWSYNGRPYSGFTYKIKNDIDMTGITIAPIHNFTGSVFDGENHTISNLTITNSNNTKCCSLFDTINGNILVRDIRLSNITLNSQGSSTIREISPLFGHITSINAIYNFHINGVTVNVYGNPTGNLYFGGIVGNTTTALTITNCSFECDTMSILSGGRVYWGGIVGQASANTTIGTSSFTNAKARIETGGHVMAGGALGDGKSYEHNINGYNTNIWLYIGTVPTKYTHAGGLVGNLYTNNGNLTVNNSTISGGVTIIDTSSSANIGTVYGFGKAAYTLNYTVTDWTMPNSSGTIHTGDPSGN